MATRRMGPVKCRDCENLIFTPRRQLCPTCKIAANAAIQEKRLAHARLYEKEKREKLKGMIGNVGKSGYTETYPYQYKDRSGNVYFVGDRYGMIKLKPICQGCNKKSRKWGPIFTEGHGRETKQVLLCLDCYISACDSYQKAS